MQVHNEVPYALSFEESEVVFKQRLPPYGYHDLWNSQAERPQPRTQTGRQNESFHTRSRCGGSGGGVSAPALCSRKYRDNTAHAFCIAFARWLMRFFTSGESSANVFVCPSAIKSGS